MKIIARLAGVVALALLAVPASAQESCDEWNTSRFFNTATAESVSACLAAGADVNPSGGVHTPLHFASTYFWDTAVIRVLLAAGAEVDARNQRGATPLHLAAGQNPTLIVVVELVEAGADLKARDRDGNTPLHLARRNRNAAVAHLLLELGSDPTAVNDAGEVADPTDCGYWNTQDFARIATAEATAACLEAGADVNERDENGNTPLLLATGHWGGGMDGSPANEDPAVVRLLLEAGADVNARNNGGSTPLANAAGGKLVGTTRGGMLDLAEIPAIVAVLLAAGAEVGSTSGATLLNKAAFVEGLETVTMLLEAGADIHAREGDGDTPLLSAADYGGFRNPEVLEALVEAGADVNDRNEHGETVLGRALGSPANRVTEVVRSLLDLGADPNAPGFLSSPLHQAARRGDNPELITLLLDAGADVNARARGGDTPLHRADGTAVIAALLSGGAEVDARGARGQTPLHRAIETKKPANVAALIESGADVHALIGDGNTPLHMASRWPSRMRRWEDDPPEADTLMVVALVAAGADINARNELGETPLHVAARNRHDPVADKLLALGADPLAMDDLGRAPKRTVCDWMVGQFFQFTPWQSVLGCLQAGADVHARGESGETPLHGLASEAGGVTSVGMGLSVHVDTYPFARIISAFVEAGADVHARDRRGATPLHEAVGRTDVGGTNLAAALLDVGAEVNARDSEGKTPLHRAAGAWAPNDSMVSLLVNAGADLHTTDDGGRTALHVALRSYHPAVAARLIELGTDTGVQDDSGRVANPVDCANLNTASFFHVASTETVAGCIERGAYVNARFSDSLGDASSMPLHLASAWARDPAIVSLLVGAGADVNAIAGGETPLHRAAARTDNPAIIVALVEAGAELDVWSPGIHSPYGYTALHIAVEGNRNPAVTAALLEVGADVHARQEDGPTPLHDAATAEVVALLLEAGADIEARATYLGWRQPNGRDMTPLHVAAKRGNAAVFMALLDAGADPSALDIEGKTPLDHAREQKALQELEVVKRSGR